MSASTLAVHCTEGIPLFFFFCKFALHQYFKSLYMTPRTPLPCSKCCPPFLIQGCKQGRLPHRVSTMLWIQGSFWCSLHASWEPSASSSKELHCQQIHKTDIVDPHQTSVDQIPLHRMCEVGTDIWRSSGPNPLFKQWHLELLAQDHIDMSLDLLPLCTGYIPCLY